MNAHDSRGRGYVIVGLDSHGQPTGLLSVAADEAQRRGTDLAVVTILRPSLDPGLNIQGLRHEEHLAEALALQSLQDVTASLRSSHPQVSVTTYCLGEGEVGPNREPLLWAQLLVIGTQDRYGRQSLVLGSVSRLLLTSSRCPVLVVPDGPGGPRHGRSGEPPLILVGVSEHPSDAAVVRAAYAEAAGRDCEVLLVHTYSLRADEAPEQASERARSVLTEYLAQAPEGTQVSMTVIDDQPAPALLRLAAGATLLVIGGRTGALSGLVRGSVSRAVLEAVPCPVLAVPRNLSAGPITGLTMAPAESHSTSSRPG